MKREFTIETLFDEGRKGLKTLETVSGNNKFIDGIRHGITTMLGGCLSKTIEKQKVEGGNGWVVELWEGAWLVDPYPYHISPPHTLMIGNAKIFDNSLSAIDALVEVKLKWPHDGYKQAKIRQVIR